MEISLTILGYLMWHYSRAIVAINIIWKNLFYFIIDFFSLRLLIRNFLDPWKKMNDVYPAHFDLKGYLFAFLTNIIVRIIGIIMRLALLITGTVACILFIILYPILFIVWIILPIGVIGLIFIGAYLIII